MDTKTTAQLINQSSGKTEYYTPDYITIAAAETMGKFYDPGGNQYRFELDAASSQQANGYVNAWRFFSKEIDALNHSWTAASVWLNHPYSREENRLWINKAVNEYLTGNAKQLCMIVWASTSEQWFYPLFQFPICFLKKRVKFIDPNRALMSGSTKSSAVIYMGPHNERFQREFGNMGHIMVPPKRQLLDPAILIGLSKIRQLAADLLGHSQNGR